MLGDDGEPYSEVPDEVSVSDGKEGFPHQSKYPPIVAFGLMLLGFGLAWPSWLFTGLVAAPVTLVGVGGWAYQYGVEDYEDDLVPEQKRQLLGVKSGKLAMWLFIVSEMLLFAGLFVTYFYLEARSGPWPPEGLPHLHGPYALGLAAILLTSGVTMHWGLNGVKKGDRSQFTYGLAATLLLGLVFLAGQVNEYANVMNKGLTPFAGAYGSSFYVLTGTHMAHVVVGMAFLSIVGVRAWYFDHFDEERHLWVEAATQYWHFVDAIWLLIVGFVYL